MGRFFFELERLGLRAGGRPPSREAKGACPFPLRGRAERGSLASSVRPLGHVESPGRSLVELSEPERPGDRDRKSHGFEEFDARIDRRLDSRAFGPTWPECPIRGTGAGVLVVP